MSPTLYEEQLMKWKKLMEELEGREAAGEKIGIWPSPPDPRDFHIEDLVVGKPVKLELLPKQVTLPLSPIVMNQRQTSFCAGASGAAVSNNEYHKIGAMPPGGFSMRFLYWVAKQYDGIPHLEGTYLRTICKVMRKYGACPDSFLPFQNTMTKANITQQMLDAAAEYKIESYAQLFTMEDMMRALSEGYYLLIATFVTRDNWRAPGGYLSYPKGQNDGGHATYLFGYDDFMKYGLHEGYFSGMNSWGTGWGDQGKFYMPYDYYNYRGNEVPGGRPFLEAWAVKFPHKDGMSFKPTPDLPKQTISFFQEILSMILAVIMKWIGKTA